jgi:hypothetical protein
MSKGLDKRVAHQTWGVVGGCVRRVMKEREVLCSLWLAEVVLELLQPYQGEVALSHVLSTSSVQLHESLIFCCR